MCNLRASKVNELFSDFGLIETIDLIDQIWPQRIRQDDLSLEHYTSSDIYLFDGNIERANSYSFFNRLVILSGTRTQDE